MVNCLQKMSFFYTITKIETRSLQMKQFDISTDSTCDLYADEYKDLDVSVGKLNYTIEKNGVLTEYLDDFKCYEDYVNFYNELRAGGIAKTTILNLQAHIDLFTDMAKRGIVNALHISQSNGLSPTIDNARKAIEIVKEQYPNINYLALECKTTTIGEGMLVKMACKLRDEGLTNQEAYDIIEKEKMHVQHFVIVDDLMYLKRGGRISGPKAFIGTILKVKPIIQFTKEGKLPLCTSNRTYILRVSVWERLLWEAQSRSVLLCCKVQGLRRGSADTRQDLRLC